MRVIIKAEKGQGEAEVARANRIAATAVTKAMRETGRLASDAANREIHAAGFASKKWEMRAKNYPTSGISLLPEVWLHTRVNFEDVFEKGADIQGKPWLWLPLPSVPRWPGDATRQMSPKKYIQSIGPLVTMRRPGKTPLLGAVVSGTLKPQPFGRFVTRSRLRKGNTGKGATTVIPMFVGVRTATIRKRFDVESAVDVATEGIQGLYVKYEGEQT